METEKFLDKFNQIKENSVSDEVIKTISDREKNDIFSNITSSEKRWLFKTLAIQRIFFPKNDKVKDIVKDYLTLSVSQGGLGLKTLVDIHKTEINNMVQQQK